LILSVVVKQGYLATYEFELKAVVLDEVDPGPLWLRGVSLQRAGVLAQDRVTGYGHRDMPRIRLS